MAWEVITAFTMGHVAVEVYENESLAIQRAKHIASDGFDDYDRREIIPASHIGAVRWREVVADGKQTS